jgi:hypothetical protein
MPAARTRGLALLVLFVGGWCVATPDAATGQTIPIFWVEGGPGGRLGRVNLDGTGFQVLQSGLSNPTGVDVDPYNNHVYWAEPGGLNNGRIRRANLDGSNVVDILTGLASPAGISLDFVQQKIYWTNASYDPINNPNLNQPTVQWSNFDGSNVQTLISGENAIAIEKDDASNKIYYIAGQNTNTSTVKSANLNGSSIQTLYTAPVSSGGTALNYGVTVGYDTNFYPGGRVYFTLQDGANASNTVRSMPLTGGVDVSLVSSTYPFYGVDFHPYYEIVISANIFGQNNSGEISRMNPNGSGYQLISNVGLNRQVNDVAIWPFLPPLVPEPGSAAILVVGVVGFASIGRRRRATYVAERPMAGSL